MTAEFSLDWDWILVGTQQLIVARVDGRGSDFRGQRSVSDACLGCSPGNAHLGTALALQSLFFVTPFRVLTAIYQGLGTVDLEDQLVALEFVTISAHYGHWAKFAYALRKVNKKL